MILDGKEYTVDNLLGSHPPHRFLSVVESIFRVVSSATRNRDENGGAAIAGKRTGTALFRARFKRHGTRFEDRLRRQLRDVIEERERGEKRETIPPTFNGSSPIAKLLGRYERNIRSKEEEEEKEKRHLCFYLSISRYTIVDTRLLRIVLSLSLSLNPENEREIDPR